MFIYGPIKNHTSVGDEFGLKVLFQCKHHVCVMNVNSREKFRIKSAAPSAGRTGKEQETKGCDKKKQNIKVIICLMHNVHICKLLTTLFIHPQLLSTYKASDDIPLFCFRTSPSFNKTQRCGGQHDSFESYG